MYSSAHVGKHMGTQYSAGFVERHGILRRRSGAGVGCSPAGGLSESGDILNNERSIADDERDECDGANLYGGDEVGTDNPCAASNREYANGADDGQEWSKSSERTLLLHHSGERPEVDEQGARPALRPQAEARDLDVPMQKHIGESCAEWKKHRTIKKLVSVGRWNEFFNAF